MPPALSDDEATDRELTPPPVTTKKSGRGRKSLSKEETPENNLKVKREEDEFGEDDPDDDEQQNEEVYACQDCISRVFMRLRLSIGNSYVVERICNHMIDPKTGEPRFQVKWEGYDDPSDMTWEPEENLLENAQEALNEYLESIGGREKLFEETANALKTKKRGRPSSAHQQANANKRSRRNGEHPVHSEPPSSAKEEIWKPPPGSWEDHIDHIDVCVDEQNKLLVYLRWKNGQKTQHPTEVVYQRCPQKMLRFYESHVVIRQPQPPPEQVQASKSVRGVHMSDA